MAKKDWKKLIGDDGWINTKNYDGLLIYPISVLGSEEEYEVKIHKGKFKKRSQAIKFAREYIAKN